MEHYKERDRKSTFSGALGNDETLKDPKNVASAFNNLFITIIENLTFNK